MTSSRAVGIDIHAHGVPRAFLQEIRRSRLGGVDVELKDGRYLVTFPGHKQLRPVAGIMLEFKERLAWLDGQGMHQQMLAPWLDVHGQELPAAEGQEWVRQLNDAMAASVAESGGRLLAHATLHLADPAGAAKELDRAVRTLGMTGCMIPTNVPGGSLDEARYDAVWEAASALQLPIVLHPPTVAPSGCLFGDTPPAFRGVFGRLIDTTITTARLIVAGVFDRYPDLRVVLVHGGGFLPYQTGRFDGSFQRDGHLPSDTVRRLYYDTCLLSPEALRMLIDLVGEGRVMIGSDYAAGPSEREGVRITGSLEELGLADQVHDMVLYKNAESLFGAKAVASS